MTAMTESEWRRFMLEGTRTGKLATVRADGRPHVTPIWFLLDGDEVVFTTHRDGVKARNILRDPRAAACVDEERPLYSFVLVEGVASVSEDLAELRAWATRIGARYMGDDRAAEYGARNAVPGELLVRLRIDGVVAERDVAG